MGVTGRHGDVMAAILFQQSQTALLELSFALLRRWSCGRCGSFLLDHHHIELSLQQVDFSLSQFLLFK